MNRRQAGVAVLIAVAVSILLWLAVITTVLLTLHLTGQPAR